MIEQSQTIFVSVAHRYWNPRWSEAHNREVYGRNASHEGVGSNLALTLTVETDSTNELSLESPLQMLKNLCDHRCFFSDIPEFADRPSTLETISLFLGEKLFTYPMPNGARAKRLKVAENDSLSCTVYAANALKEVCISEKHLNLLCTVQLPVDPESGLTLARGVMWQAVREVAPQFSEPDPDVSRWGQALFAALEIKVKALRELEIDLGSQQSLRISSHS